MWEECERRKEQEFARQLQKRRRAAFSHTSKLSASPPQPHPKQTVHRSKYTVTVSADGGVVTRVTFAVSILVAGQLEWWHNDDERADEDLRLHWFNSTLTHRLWFMNKRILVWKGCQLPVLVGNSISKYKAEADGERTGRPVCLLVWLRVVDLTSLPIQRCCIPTLFSHLWWRLILQALQRRPCFAVFPARNTTCLAVVPDMHRKRESRFAFTSGTGLESTRVRKKKKKKGWRKWKICTELHRPGNNLANVTYDTHFWQRQHVKPGQTFAHVHLPLTFYDYISHSCWKKSGLFWFKKVAMSQEKSWKIIVTWTLCVIMLNDKIAKMQPVPGHHT